MESLEPQLFLEEPGQVPPVPWTSWISSFESFVARSRCKDKKGLLLRFLGAGGRRVLWSLPGPTETYEDMVAALRGHYKAREDAAKAWEDRHKVQKDSDKAHAKKVKKIIIVSATVGTALLAGIGAAVAAPFVLAGIGFTAGGIAAGSLAAGMMSSAAVASGGGVAAGSLVAILQSAGAVGLSAAASAAVAGTGAAVGGVVGGATAGAITSLNKKDKKDPKKPEDEDSDDEEDADLKKQS